VTAAERRAQRLLRSYPRGWRDRYGDEFVALLVDDLADRPRSWQRDLDVLRAGCAARLVSAAPVCFVACALSIWTQLANGWLTASPDSGTVAVSLVALSAWLAGMVAVSAFLATRLTVRIVRAFRSGHARILLRPLLILASSGAVFVIGLGIVAADSPGARGSGHNGAFAKVAALGWAATQSISTFWLHPHRLLALPAADLAWMVICPIAVAAAVSSLMRIVRITGGLPRRTEFSLQQMAFLPCLVGAAVWVCASQHAANISFRAGTLDLFLVAAMAAASYAVRRDAPVDH
jgi:hypothetical protein